MGTKTRSSSLSSGEFQASSGNKDDSRELKRQTRQKIESGLKGGDSDTTCHMNSEKDGPMRD